MNGKYVVFAIVGITLIFGIGVWYTQTRAYYAPVELGELTLTLGDGTVQLISFDQFDGINAETSPLRFRACFILSADSFALVSDAEPYPDAAPLIAPSWFDCFDAQAIGAAIESGDAQAFLSQAEIRPGADRIIAVFPDGRAYAWHQWNGSLDN